MLQTLKLLGYNFAESKDFDEGHLLLPVTKDGNSYMIKLDQCENIHEFDILFKEYKCAVYLAKHDIGPQVYGFHSLEDGENLHTSCYIMQKLDITLSKAPINAKTISSLIELFQKTIAAKFVPDDIHVDNIMLDNGKAYFIDGSGYFNPPMNAYYGFFFIAYQILCDDRCFYPLLDYLYSLLTFEDLKYINKDKQVIPEDYGNILYYNLILREAQKYPLISEYIKKI